ncbi:hypothetical protein HPP92_000264 [Vanilla planifolia]|uniref:Uncharacterized protein n=1 Tax=Vanilla planifolia TaxID=51239 RepID=A0A835S0Z6_VANPL|nr:hypothetical protein HPP92_000264 [Vanilla planifolia]
MLFLQPRLLQYPNKALPNSHLLPGTVHHSFGRWRTKPNIQTLGAEQFDVLDSKERARKFSFFNWWTFAAFCGNLFSTTVLIYIQNSVSWSIGYGVPTAGLSIAIAVFLLGSPFYRHKPPSGSPVVRVAKVLVAAVGNWSFRLPEDPKTLHELDSSNTVKPNAELIILLR